MKNYASVTVNFLFEVVSVCKGSKMLRVSYKGEGLGPMNGVASSVQL
jgi:hypothetical protein